MQCPLETPQGAELLLDYCAGRLDVQSATAFGRHLGDCQACRASVEAQKAVWESLERWEAPPVSADFDRRLLQRMEEERGSGWRRLATSWPAPAPRPIVALSAACVVILLALVLQWPDSPDVPPAARAETVDIEQVERTLEDMEMLRQLNLIPPAEAGVQQPL